MSQPLHVDYVADEAPATALAELLGVVLAEPANVALFVVGGVAGLLALALTPRLLAVPDVRATQRTLASYRPYLPWMLRLSLGLPLVGAGFAGYLFSPGVEVAFRLPQILIGFALLFGGATRLAALAGFVLYAVGLATDATLLLASEYAGGFLAIILLGAGQPSADGLLRRLAATDGTLVRRARLDRLFLERHVPLDASRSEIVGVVLRLFLGINFIYLGATQKLLNGGQAMAVVGKYDLTAVVPVSPEMWVVSAGLAEIAVGVLLLAGVATRGVASFAFVLFTVTLFALPDDPVLAHISLFGLASALMVTGSGRWGLGDRLFGLLDRTPDVGPA